jgi:hypothetical protein
VTDLQEAPATPEEDHGGDERIGLRIAGGILVFLGWGLAGIVNVLLHLAAPVGGLELFGSWRVFPTLGPFAWAALGLGLFTGAIGVGLVYLAQSSPKGPFVLPGAAY